MTDSDSPYDPLLTQYDPTTDDPTVVVVNEIAELERRAVESMPVLYDTINDLLDHIWTNPPAPEAQVTIEFTYAGYRITLHQDGSARFLKLPEDR
ncbi:MAG: HalOD1 output domain-containing protein [Halobaculum sp.]